MQLWRTRRRSGGARGAAPDPLLELRLDVPEDALLPVAGEDRLRASQQASDESRRKKTTRSAPHRRQRRGASANQGEPRLITHRGNLRGGRSRSRRGPPPVALRRRLLCPHQLQEFLPLLPVGELSLVPPIVPESSLARSSAGWGRGRGRHGGRRRGGSGGTLGGGALVGAPQELALVRCRCACGRGDTRRRVLSEERASVA